MMKVFYNDRGHIVMSDESDIAYTYLKEGNDTGEVIWYGSEIEAVGVGQALIKAAGNFRQDDPGISREPKEYWHSTEEQAEALVRILGAAEEYGDSLTFEIYTGPRFSDRGARCAELLITGSKRLARGESVMVSQRIPITEIMKAKADPIPGAIRALSAQIDKAAGGE